MSSSLPRFNFLFIMMKFLSLIIAIFFWLNLNSQAIIFYRADALWVSTDFCSVNKLPCEWDYTDNDVFAGYAYHPNGSLIAVVGESIDQTFEYNNVNIYNFNQSNCSYDLVNSIPLSKYTRVASNGLNIDFNGRIYFTLQEFDEITGQYINTFNRISNSSSDIIERLLTLVPNHRFWEMHQQDGKYFLVEQDKPYIRVYNSDFVIIDTIIMQKHITGLTSFSFSCDSVITYASHLDITSEEFSNSGPGNTVYISKYDIETNTLTPICNYFLNEDAVTFLTSPLEFLASDPECDLLIDLDRDNSTGVYPYDYLDEKQYCSSIKIPIADDDTYIHSSAPIDSIRLTLSGIQDIGMEVLMMDPVPPGIDFLQLTDSTYLLTSSVSSDSLYTTALEAMYYLHTGPQQSLGTRLIFVQGFNEIKEGILVTSQIHIAPTITTHLYSTTCLSSEAGIFTSSYTNQFGCDSLVITTIELVPGNIINIQLTTCDKTQTGVDSTFYTNQSGCDSLVITEVLPAMLPDVNIDVLSHQNGYDISCQGLNDGMVQAHVAGAGPFTYAWSNGEMEQQIQNLGPGDYSLTVTDANTCRDTTYFTLLEPDPFDVSLEINSPSCFGEDDGLLTVNTIGGVGPISFSLNGSASQTSPYFDGLASGTYTISAVDANGCEMTEIVWMNVPMPLHVDLGNDQNVFAGDTTHIVAIVNVPFDSLAHISWSGLSDQSCDTCLSQIVAPIVTTTYAITITNAEGCKDQDSLTLFINYEDHFFIPNIFSPNGDGINDELITADSPDILFINSWSIFDRWGNRVFQANNFLPGDATSYWDGTKEGKELNPGVFAYQMIVQLKDGREIIQYGDITLIK